MLNLKKFNLDQAEETDSLDRKSLEFIAAGIACNCFVTLAESGLLNTLVDTKHLSKKDIEKSTNPILVKSALMTLEKCQIVQMSKDGYKITKFGANISKFSGLISMLFTGYGNLMAHQDQIVKKKATNSNSFIRSEAVSKAAVQLAANTFDPILIQEFTHLKFSGTICDLGCGYGRMLSQICEIHGNSGLGFECDRKVVKQAKKQFKDTNIAIEHGNIIKLQGIWEDVVVLMQCHVFHDFTPNKACIKLMNSFLKNFPNLRYFFYLDTVAPSDDEFLPGFDYVHGLLGIQTRTYEETQQMFDESAYEVLKEIKIEGLPNSYLWILAPKQNLLPKRKK